MLTKDKFKYYMNELKKELERQEKITEALQLISDMNIYENKLFDTMVELLEDSMGDDFSSISFYIWEHDWGNRDCMFQENDGVEIWVNDLDALYGFLTM